MMTEAKQNTLVSAPLLGASDAHCGALGGFAGLLYDQAPGQK